MNQGIDTRSKTINIKALKESDETITDNKSIADTMNSFFCNVGKSSAKNVAPKPNHFLMVIVEIHPAASLSCFPL